MFQNGLLFYLLLPSILHDSASSTEDIQAFGWDSFLVEIILDSVPAVDLRSLEDLFVDAEDTMVPRGYNLRRPRAIPNPTCIPTCIPNPTPRAECKKEGSVFFCRNRWVAKAPFACQKYLGSFHSEAAARAALATHLEYLQEQPTLSFFVKAIEEGVNPTGPVFHI